MALIKCPECGNEVSDKSVKCVNCGYPISEKQNNNFDTNPVFILQKSFNKRLLLIIPAVLILIIIILVAAGKSQAEIDQEYSNTILGSWNFNHQMKSSGISEKTGTKFNVETNFTLKESIVYLKNHTFISGQELVSVIMKNNKTYKTSLSIVNKGSWQINNGKYIEKIVNSSQVPVDKESQLVLEKNPELFKFLENDDQPIVREIVELDEKKLTMSIGVENYTREFTLIRGYTRFPEARNGKLRLKSEHGNWYTYDGQCVNNLPNGQGKALYDNGTIYNGMYKDGKFNGKGTINYSTGDYYTGDFVNHKRHGYGKEISANGETYEGNFEDDMRHGFGTYTWTNGTKYAGNWRKNKQDGEGKYYDKYGNVTSEGNWAFGKYYEKTKSLLNKKTQKFKL